MCDCAATNLYAAPHAPFRRSIVSRKSWCTLSHRGGMAEHSGSARDTSGAVFVGSRQPPFFRHYAGRNARLLLPADNYPVHEPARAASLTHDS